MLSKSDELSIGEVSRRSGLAHSALHHYEALGLIASRRTPGGHRIYRRAVLRRLAVIRAGQRVGLALDEIRESFSALGPHEAPTRQQWRALSRQWRPLLDARIADLEKVRDNLDHCVGCGCLSMRQCSLYNPQDTLGAGQRAGAQRLFPAPQDHGPG